jgi:hypothetical protein
MDEYLGSYESWEGNQESDMYLNVVKEGTKPGSPDSGAEGGEENQRQPRRERYCEQPAIQQFQVVPAEMQPP